MSKMDEFKEFARSNPNLNKYVKNGEMTWQKFYELYDIYGEDSSVWGDYIKDNENGISKILSNLNIDKIEEHLQNASKTIDLISELSKKEDEVITPDIDLKPLDSFFKD